MKYSCSKIVLLGIIFSIQIIQLPAQYNQHKYEIGFGLSAFIYQGDLTPTSTGSYRTIRPGINLHGSKILSASFLWRTNLAIGGLKGDETKYDHPEYRKHRALKFRTPVIELAQLIVWNPLGSNYDDKGLSPYIFTGAGLSFLNIKRDWSGFDADYFGETSDLGSRLEVDAAYKPPRIIPVLPVGIGLRYAVSSRVAINAESLYRFVFTDYLDGFSKAVNPSEGDHYHTISVGAIYRIGKKNLLDCPVIRY